LPRRHLELGGGEGNRDAGSTVTAKGRAEARKSRRRPTYRSSAAADRPKLGRYARPFRRGKPAGLPGTSQSGAHVSAGVRHHRAGRSITGELQEATSKYGRKYGWQRRVLRT